MTMRWLPIALGLLILFSPHPGRGQETSGEDLDLTVSQMQAGGFVFDKGTRLVSDPRLKISLTPMFETLRTQAPLNLNVRLQWNGSGLLEGRLLCDIYAAERYVGSWRSHELAVNNEVLSFPLTLPPSPLYNGRDPFNLRIAFEAEDRTILMDQRDLPVESTWSRNFVVGVVAPENVTRISGFRSDSQTPQVADIFQLANFHDFPLHASQLVTNTTPVVSRDFPLDPLRLTAFDMVVVSPESLRELRPPQWQSLATWIRAGGRACLIATMAVPENLRPAWRELFNEQPGETSLTFSDKGIPEFAAGGTSLRARIGCGRVICLTEPAKIDSRAWLQDLLWLYGIRDAVQSSILSTGKWTIGAPPSTAATVAFHPFVPVKRPLAEMRRPLNSPEVGRISPITIFLLLGTCLMLIGPVDYFVLGRLGMRKMTWVFLPCVAIATTWATMRVSQGALGAKDYARSVSVADLDRIGRVCRVSRFEQRYAGTEAIHRRSLGPSLRLDFERPLLGWNGASNPLVPWTTVRGGDDQSNQPPLRYSGKVTGGYELLEPMFQWSPRLFRETTFGDDGRINSAPLQTIRWSELENLTWVTTDGRRKIAELVHEVLPEAAVYVRFSNRTAKCGDPEPEAAPNTVTPAPVAESPEAFIHLIGNATSCQRSFLDTSLIYERAVTRPFGLFGLVRERSPTCGADLEDFQWIDSEDPTEAVLMILLPGEDSVIYRRRLALAAAAR
ncbi:hypothetical protein Pan44_55560 [Caulifigura coniformis]|uniref:DUF4350 domain-containing protein n=1 Tax=Caulifigura coniformis TaxID=2527983 RepID=A0A517SMY4_9PLAN|nr:hypothetical protein [Caulifigura coniformis]QDT57487.1 hypothetical protein Pan44_55560 [Caulifigura coniformis]